MIQKTKATSAIEMEIGAALVVLFFGVISRALGRST